MSPQENSKKKNIYILWLYSFLYLLLLYIWKHVYTYLFCSFIKQETQEHGKTIYISTKQYEENWYFLLLQTLVRLPDSDKERKYILPFLFIFVVIHMIPYDK